MRYYYINRDWMLSAIARRVYRLAATLSLLLFVLVFAINIIPNALLPVLKLFLLAGVLGAATTLVAMEYFLFGFDDSSALNKLFWFGVMLLPLFGAPLYCFFVYSRCNLHKSSQYKRVQGASA